MRRAIAFQKLVGRVRLFAALAALWTLIGLVFAAASYLAAASENQAASLPDILLANLFRFYVWAAFSPFIFGLAQRFDFARPQRRLANALIHAFCALILALLHSIVYTVLLWTFVASFSRRYDSIFASFQQSMFYGSLTLAILIYSLIVAAAQAFLFYRTAQNEQEKAAKLQAALARAELQTLKMQLQPHFLFNTLHSIQSLVLIDPAAANRMIARLGDFLRLTLEVSGAQTVLLEEELRFARGYLEIEQIRFQDRLTIEFEIAPETLVIPVPHLILQPIIENAIKHAIAPRAAPGSIKVSAAQTGAKLRLQVTDDGAGCLNGDETRGERKGTGLANVRARLEQLYQSDYDFELRNEAAGGLTVALTLPVSL